MMRPYLSLMCAFWLFTKELIVHFGQHCSQIDFVLARRKDKRACLDCKVIPGECVVSQHKLLVADFRFQVRARRDKQAKIERTKW